MTINGWLQILLFFALILAVTKPAGLYMAKVFSRWTGWLRERPETVDYLARPKRARTGS